MDYLKIITWLVGWAAGLVVMGLIARMVVQLFCFGYGC